MDASTLTAIPPIAKHIEPVFETVGRRNKLVGFRAVLNGEAISPVLFTDRAEAVRALDEAAYALCVNSRAADPEPCKMNVLGTRWTVCGAPAEGPCYCDVVVQAIAADNDTAPGDDCPDHGPYADDECPKCETCEGKGWIPAYGTGDQAGGYADTCPDCGGVAWPLMRMPEGDVLDAEGMRVQPLAVTRQSIQIESTMRRCHNCGADHRTWQCPEVASKLFAPEQSWKDVALGRELCRMRWRNFKAFVALLMSVPTEHLVIYAESYIAFIRDYNSTSDLTTKEVLGGWMRIIADEGDRGPAAPALRLAA